jgi:hypothetical protein
MAESDSPQDGMNRQNFNSGALERELDAALAKFATAEPRPGLDQRILANLRIEHKRAAKRSWWRWPAVAALAVVIIVSLSVAWRSGKPAQNIGGQQPSATVQTNQDAKTLVANNGGSGSIRPLEAGPGSRVKSRALSDPATIVVPAPKLEQFPSPRPLSEQETILTRYVANYPEHAALIAQARSDELRRDSAEEMAVAASADGQNSQ